ncbi:sulfite exporter TauE/SafE family protein [Lacihabitans sp. LS3-19]|uniref:sulfite exporter TauE/SafE family protein n=1 Tax=Lacihabitans sp. LS3-19 TaxID=2487335 RepID=UPI0020CDBAC1|nr:sulfite exporter TauE/SafE family protein [Lacihabitans sp. LS3-19]
MIEIIGYIGALLMGVSLGLIGGGGSILTVPILVYLFSVDAVLATAYSLFIVGFTSILGSASHIKQGNIHWRTAIVFGIPAIISVFITRQFLVPLIPKEIFTIGTFHLDKPLLMLLLFAFLMVFASYSMIKPSKKIKEEAETAPKYNYPLILIEGAVVGMVTGMVGAGGGFLIIPALVLLAKLPMKKAVGTSLVIIGFKSLIGFLGDVNGSEVIDWKFLMIFSSIAAVGIFLGSYYSKKVKDEKLKPAFGYFVLIMGIYIITKELFFK